MIKVFNTDDAKELEKIINPRENHKVVQVCTCPIITNGNTSGITYTVLIEMD